MYINQSRKLSKQKLYGILSTHSVSMSGYPFGSLVQYCFDNNGEILLLLSQIAQHTKNIQRDNKSSLTIIENNTNDIQNAARATILGNVTKCNDTDDAYNIYYKLFPNSQNYHQTHDFNLYRLSIERVRYIGGFGDIHWISRDNFIQKQIFSDTEIDGAIVHMNNDHQMAIKHYLMQLGIVSNTTSNITHFDQEGMWIQIENQNHYISFDYPVDNMKDLRAVLTKMAAAK